MKLQLNKLMAGLVLAGSAVALVGCGGGDAPTLTVSTDSVTKISAATLSTAKVLVAAADGVDFTLPALTFAKDGGGTPATSPTDSVLEITKNTTATGNEFANFTLTSGTSKVTGEIETGSCKFKVVSADGIFLNVWVVGQTYVQDPCSLVLETTGVAVGVTIPVPLKIVLGNTIVLGNANVEVTIEAGEGNTAEVKVGDEVVSEQPLPTGT